MVRFKGTDWKVIGKLNEDWSYIYIFSNGNRLLVKNSELSTPIEFMAGDRVKCVRPSGDLEIGSVYTVLRAEHYFVVIGGVIHSQENFELVFRPHRFKINDIVRFGSGADDMDIFVDFAPDGSILLAYNNLDYQSDDLIFIESAENWEVVYDSYLEKYSRVESSPICKHTDSGIIVYPPDCTKVDVPEGVDVDSFVTGLNAGLTMRGSI